MAAPDPKPRKRHVAPPNWWAGMEAKKTGRCQCCGRMVGRHRTSWHHLIGKDLGGDDDEHNLSELCGSGTTGCHGEVQRLNRAFCKTLRSNLTGDQLAYIIGRKGRGFLDRYYPP